MSRDGVLKDGRKMSPMHVTLKVGISGHFPEGGHVVGV